MAANVMRFTPPTCALTRDGGRTVISLGGEHDAATADSVAIVFAQALALRDPELVVDLSEVRFMGAATVRVILHAREALFARGASFALRSVSAAALHTLHACRLSELLERESVDASSAA